MKSQNRIHATYHFLGLAFYLLPIVGLLFPMIYHFIRKSPSIEEQNHFRAVINFCLSLSIYLLVLNLFFPKPVVTVLGLILASCAALISLANVYLAAKGQEANYPLALPMFKPRKPDGLSVEEMMASAEQQSFSQKS